MRVAWIETPLAGDKHQLGALSPPVRVAWIETISISVTTSCPLVATREGDVDRNNKMEVGIEDANRRHP